MATLSESFRQHAVEQRKASNVLMEANPTLGQISTEKLVASIVGQVNANALETMADALDYLQKTAGSDGLLDRRRKILERNDAIRTAAAKGDWNEFDKLVSGK